MSKITRVLTHASELLTCEGVRRKDGRKIDEEDLGRIEDGALVYSARKAGKKEIPEKIIWAGPTSDLPKRYLRAPRISLKGGRAIVPGFVDCHTHLVFAGDRSEEFALRCGGMSYQEVAARGGGILTTVSATREATIDDLERVACARIEESRTFGVRTLEIKSGYGLSRDAEMKTLEVVKRLKKRWPEMAIHATFLGAHAFPKERSRNEYLADLRDMIDEVARRKLADSCDVFIDEGYYTAGEGRAILEHARARGMGIRLHADELANTGGAQLAAQLGALSADHLLRISEPGIRAIASSKTVAVLLPGTAFYLKEAHAPARALLDAGAAVALATDFNPGTCMTLNLPAIMTIAALYLRMTRAEILAAVTYNGAKALALEGRRGTLERGMDAAITVLPFARFEEAYYRFAWR